jgi:hypothetical protein
MPKDTTDANDPICAPHTHTHTYVPCRCSRWAAATLARSAACTVRELASAVATLVDVATRRDAAVSKLLAVAAITMSSGLTAPPPPPVSPIV